MFSVEEIKELIKAVDSSSLDEIEIMSKDSTLKMRKNTPSAVSAVQADAQPAAAVATAVAEVSASNASPSMKLTESFEVITAPMVGVFYEAPSPDSNPFVSVGQAVSKGDTVCIIEAMKLMNEITAEKSGIIAEVCVSNGEIVEYGQPLFKIR